MNTWQKYIEEGIVDQSVSDVVAGVKNITKSMSAEERAKKKAERDSDIDMKIKAKKEIQIRNKYKNLIAREKDPKMKDRLRKRRDDEISNLSYGKTKKN